MRLWWEVARRGFRRYATYRWATLAGVFTNSVFGFMRAYILLEFVERAGGEIAGADYSGPELLAYSFVTQGLIMPLYLWGWYEIADTVTSGQIATDLYRPLDYQLYWLFQDYGRALYHALMRGLPPLGVALLFFELALPTGPVTIVLFAVSVVLAVTISFALRFIVNLSAFWFLEVRGVHTVAAAAWTVLSGFIMPLALFPDAVRPLLYALPFAGMIEFPMNVFLERARGLELVATLGAQLGWAIVLMLAGRVVLGAATKKLVVQGG